MYPSPPSQFLNVNGKCFIKALKTKAQEETKDKTEFHTMVYFSLPLQVGYLVEK